MIDAIYATLDCRPQSLTGIDVGNPTHILFGSMLDYLVGIAKFLNPIIAMEFIRKNNSLIQFGNLSFNHGEQSPRLDIGNYLSDSNVQWEKKYLENSELTF